jgi:hypothetical protein
MTKKTQELEPRVLELVHAVANSVTSLNVDYAVGGALAMGAHGARRYTSDVDLFIKDADLSAVMRSLRQEGLETTCGFGSNHYIAYNPDDGNPGVHVDVIVANEEPELSAVEHAERRLVGDVELDVFRITLLVASKFYSDRPEDHFDIKMMLDRGLFDPAEVASVIRSIDPDGADDFVQLIATLTAPRTPRRRPAARKHTA